MSATISETPVSVTWNVHIHATSHADLVRELEGTLASIKNTPPKGSSLASTSKVTRKNTASVQAETDFTEDETEDDTLDEVDTTDVDEDVDDEEPELNLKTDIMPAFKKYATKNGVKAAKQILDRFKAKSVADIKPKDYQRVLNAIG